MTSAKRKSLARQSAAPRLWLAGGLGLFGLLLLAAVYATQTANTAQATTNQPVTLNGITVPPVPTLDPARVASGETLYTQYCAACHGADLQGAPNWKQRLPNGSFPPPPHDPTGHTWHHPDDQLVAITALGGDPAYNGVMPGFAVSLTTDQMATILDFIKSRWGSQEREYQWWITATSRGQP